MLFSMHDTLQQEKAVLLYTAQAGFPILTCLEFSLTLGIMSVVLSLQPGALVPLA